MGRTFLLCLVAGLGMAAWAPAIADVVVANGTILGQTVIGPADVTLAEGEATGALTDPRQAIGMEARVNLYPGRPIRPGDLAPPAVVHRNDLVTIRYENAGLLVITDGRALDRAAVGQSLRVLNLSSRNTVTGVATGPGVVTVGDRR